MCLLYQRQSGDSNGYAMFFKKGAPYIPMSKGRGFTAHFDKSDAVEETVEEIGGMENSPKEESNSSGFLY